MSKPKIVVGRTDHNKLTRLANGLLDKRPEVAEELLAELERASVLDDQDVPPQTVQMDSTVEYRTDGSSAARSVTLVYPGDADIAEGRISILTPIGTALLGLSVGQAIDFIANDGRKLVLSVLSISHAPHRALSPAVG
ncbi:nucleoside diphosphate kinase regulator [Metarhizobium album]|uniref:Nucleoside diphosphate kinase regulator n=1 Tax=Metarhizobium album TaxID=2182425 RepID=A0A2U2DLD7_9HYPH|nr:nucleoside diphosphate kinase regulator [Rhizobium album]PWE54080.1 nucleoside diphosphate kinase regulator [Rhizobium album]